MRRGKSGARVDVCYLGTQSLQQINHFISLKTIRNEKDMLAFELDSSINKEINVANDFWVNSMK